MKTLRNILQALGEWITIAMIVFILFLFTSGVCIFLFFGIKEVVRMLS